MNAKIEKNDGDVQKTYKDYSDQWSKYGESLDKEQVKVRLCIGAWKSKCLFC